MKKMLTSLKIAFFTMFISTAFGQSISNVIVSPSNLTDCSNTAVSVDAIQNCINYIYNGSSHTISGNTITVALDWQTPGPICLGALSFVQATEQLGQLASGTYTLNVITVLDGTTIQSQSQQLNVISCCPVSSSVSQTSANICVGQSATVTGTPASATNSYWSLNGNILGSTNTLNVQPTAAGSYTYYFVATDGACADSTAFTLNVNSYPSVNFGNDTTICDNQTVTLNASSGVFGSTYTWSPAVTSGSIYSVNAAGTYSVVVSNNGCTASDTIVVSTIAAPVVALGNDTTLCDGSILTLDATATASNVTYLWSDGSTNPTLTVSTAGNYQVTASSSNGCATNSDITVAYQAIPMPNLGNDTTLCQGEVITLDATTSPTGFINWNDGSGDPTITVSNSGTYSVSVSTSIGCTGTDSVTINYSNVNVDFGADTLDLINANPLTLDAGNAGATYLWNTGETTQTISVNTTGTFDVTVTDMYGCSASGAVVVVNTTSTEGIVNGQINIYPNPASQYIVIETNEANVVFARIIDVSGRVLTAVNVQNQEQINIEHLANGLYFLQFSNREGEVVGQAKFIKQ